MRNENKILHEKNLELAQNYQLAEGALFASLLEFETQKVYLDLGFSSMFAYCISSLKLSEATAYNYISVARKAKAIPELKKIVSEGELSISKARKILSVINPTNQEEWLKKAKELNTRELDKLEFYLEKTDPVRRARKHIKTPAVHGEQLKTQAQNKMRNKNNKRNKIPLAQGGLDTLENLTTLCSIHHRMIHSKELAMI